MRFSLQVIDQVREIVGETFTTEQIIQALESNDYQIQCTIEALLGKYLPSFNSFTTV